MNDPLSPLDGRYKVQVEELSRFLSESALIRTRLLVEIEWLIFICNTLKLEGTEALIEIETTALRKVIREFKEEFANEIREIEKETRHDVKAVEYFLQKVLKALKREDLIPFIHFACTSEDINNVAYALMLKMALKQGLLPRLEEVLEVLRDQAKAYQDYPMLARTHGQPASPTTLGKELKVFASRLYEQVDRLKGIPLKGKWNGATGNFNAHLVAYPEVDWLKASQEFIEGLELSWQRYSTQIEPHDYIAEICDALRRINTILLDFNRDVWTYISLGYFRQKKVESEVGSSTMPHKVNPIDFENSEGNLGIANALLSHLSEKLPISRMQRDLSDSTALRNLAPTFGYCLLAYKACLKGLSKLEVYPERLEADLKEEWALLGEAVQTVMRRYGIPDAYEQLKSFSRGQKIGKEELHEFIESLQIPEDVKKRLLELSPETYLGLAKKI